MKNLFVVVPALMCCFVCACAVSRKQADDFTTAEAFAVEFENADQAKLLADLPIGDSSGLENWSGLFIDGLPQIGGACTDERRATLRIPILPAGRHCVQDSFAVPMELYVPVYDQDRGPDSVLHPVIESGQRYDDSWRAKHIAYNKELEGVFSWAEYSCDDGKRQIKFFTRHEKAGIVCLPEAEIGCRWNLVSCRFPTEGYERAMKRMGR